MGPIPARLSGDPNHPWFHRYWSQRTKVTIGGEVISNVLTADTIEGWADIIRQPLSVIGDKFVTVRFRGDIQFSAVAEQSTQTDEGMR